MIGSTFSDRYEITGELGRGGMSVVYAAYDPLLRREVAIKVISPTYVDQRSESTIRREAQLVAKLDHPAIVPIHDFGRHGETLYLVMPRVRGETLSGVLSRQAGLRLGDVLEIGAQAAQALGYSHSRGVVHRDIKPSNMMLDGLGTASLRVRLLDFGLAAPVAESSSATETSEVPGTLAYVAPEQIAQPMAPADGRVDLYSLGVVLYECLAGEPPFLGPVYSTLYRIVHEAPLGLAERGVTIDEELEALVMSCLAKDPDQRPADGRGLARDLARYRDRLAESRWAQIPAGVSDRPPAAMLGAEPLIGRDAELTLLNAAFSAAVDGAGRLVVVGGEAGTGKTRLLNEVERLATSRRVRVLHGRFSDWETAFPYQGLCELVQDFFLGLGSSSGLVAPDVDLDDLAPDLVALYPALSELPELRGAIADDALPAPQHSGDPGRIFELLTRTVSRLAAGRPLVILIENLHAAEVALDALHYLVHRLADTPTLVVGTYRSSEVFRGHPVERFLASFADEAGFRHIEIGPLDRTGTRALVEHLVGTPGVPTSWIDRLYDITEGNPLFCRELVQSLIESGAFETDGHGLLALGEAWSIDPETMPATLQQAEERRLERLDADAVRLLSMASILGRRFDYGDLVALHGDESALEPLIDDLIAQRLLSEELRRRGDRLSFSSGILRDLLYSEMSRRRRRSLHARWAELLETRHAARLETVYPQLLDHYRAADRARETVHYGLLLARWALDHFSPDDAIRAARLALEFVEDEDVPNSRLREAELTELLARGQQILGHGERASRWAQRAADLYATLEGTVDRLAATALLGAEIAWRDRRIDEVRPWVDRGLPAAREAGDRTVLRRLLGLGATVANLRGGRGEMLYREELRRLDAGDPWPDDPPIPGGDLVAAVAVPISLIDPAHVGTIEELEVVANVFETLLVTGEGGVVVGGLADRWRVDGPTVHLELRPGLKFSDGSPLDADAVCASFLRTARLQSEILPPVFTHLDGVEAYLAGETPDIRGLSGDGRHLTFRLNDALPIFPALLTDPRTAIVRPTDQPGLLGSGPFRVVHHDERSVRLERNPHRADHPDGGPSIDSLELRVFDDSWSISNALVAGTIDLARDMTLEDFERLLRQPRWRDGLAETVKQNTYFVLWNLDGPAARQRPVRRAMAGVVRPRDLVWRSLGRLAVPATSLIPPGIVGHNAGRRATALSRRQARELVSTAESWSGTVRVVVHPIFRRRAESLLDALIGTWRGIGVDVEIVGDSLDDYFAALDDPSGVDVLIGRWNAAYEDPDNFTWGLFNSRTGLLRRFVSSPELDLVLERARQVAGAEDRLALYGKFEDQLEDLAGLLPLFYDVDYRLIAPGWRGLELTSAPPFVRYAKISKAPPMRSPTEVTTGGELQIATPVILATLDPCIANLVDHHEATAQVFETLTRVDDQARVLPWLASSFESLREGRAYRFRLRSGVRFHDGRRLTARDVRWTFERVLRARRDVSFLLLPIRGARAVADGTAAQLAGCRIVSSEELILELHQPLAFFPALLTHPGIGILPEDQDRFDGTWQDGSCGTGPFRIATFEPRRRIVLERHSQYWRPELPKADRIVYRPEADPREIANAFRGGELSLAYNLRPSDIEALRRSADFAGDYQETPSLSTYYLALNTRRGPLADPNVRRIVAGCFDLDEAVAAVGRSGVRAHCLVPPGLLGYEPPRGRPELSLSDIEGLQGVALRVAAHPSFDTQFTECRDRLMQALERRGARVETISCSLTDLLGHGQLGDVDLLLSRWVAAYPDADCFATGLYAPVDGVLAGMVGSESVAELIEKGRQETDAALRHAIYRRLEDLLAADAWLLPLFHEQTYRFAAPGVRGLRLGITVPTVRYEELWIDPGQGRTDPPPARHPRRAV